MKRRKSVANQDIISNIPEVLKDKALCCLPIKEAVRTCLLSRKWRYTWASMTELTFREDDFGSRNGNEINGVHSSLRFTDMFLSLHNGPILKCGLLPRSVEMLSTGGFIDRWLLMLSRNGIKEIQIRTNKWSNYKIPSCFFSCVELEHAYMRGCVFWLPPHFEGFKRSNTLLLQDSSARGNNIKDLVAGCPNLEKLIMSRLRSIGNINISSTKLKILVIDDVENIALLGRIFEYVSRGSLPLMLPTPFNGLTVISMVVNLSNLNEAKAALCLFQNAPNLRHFKLQLIWVSIETTAAHFWESIDHQACPFQNLDAVSLDFFSGSTAELGFLKFVLENATVLRKVQLRGNLKLGKAALKNLLKMRRASKDAEVVVI